MGESKRKRHGVGEQPRRKTRTLWAKDEFGTERLYHISDRGAVYQVNMVRGARVRHPLVLDNVNEADRKADREALEQRAQKSGLVLPS